VEYLRPDRWELFADTIPALDDLRDAGWRHVILSNHCPELPEIVDRLGIADRFDAIVNSAATGYEKPHAEAFAFGRAALGNPKTLWMIGDNPIADVEGASRAGIPAILVRTAPEDRTAAAGLVDAVAILSQDAGVSGAA
jgi:putative hydrolase of the HAD superfamily